LAVRILAASDRALQERVERFQESLAALAAEKDVAVRAEFGR
jgi:phosphoribosylcarboxyaminoimidazole (NCAIR) mutase